MDFNLCTDIYKPSDISDTIRKYYPVVVQNYKDNRVISMEKLPALVKTLLTKRNQCNNPYDILLYLTPWKISHGLMTTVYTISSFHNRFSGPENNVEIIFYKTRGEIEFSFGAGCANTASRFFFVEDVLTGMIQALMQIWLS